MVRKIFLLIMLLAGLIFSCTTTGKHSTVRPAKAKSKQEKITSITSGKLSFTKNTDRQEQKISTKSTFFTSSAKRPRIDLFKNIDFGKKLKTEVIVMIGFAGVIISLALKLLKT